MASKMFYESANRNQAPILEILRKVIQQSHFCNLSNINVLEIASGTGQHAVEFSKSIPKFQWQPTEVDERCLESITAYVEECNLQNVKKPIFYNVTQESGLHKEWEQHFDLMLAVNLIHISPWKCTEALFRVAKKFLKPCGCLLTYGPYSVDRKIYPESNVSFNASLKIRNPEWGLRDIADLKVTAGSHGLHLQDIYEMPANNKILVWIKSDS